MARYISSITGDAWIALVLEKLGIDPGRVMRLVVDARPAEILKFYITYVGDPSLLEVRPPEVNEVEILVGGK